MPFLSSLSGCGAFLDALKEARGSSFEETESSTPETTETETETTSETETETEAEDDSGLAVVFLDVGQGDAAIVDCDGHRMIIDGGDWNQAEHIRETLKGCEISSLDYVVATHSDSDHIGGLVGGLKDVEIGTVFCTESGTDDKSLMRFEEMLDARGKKITIPVAGDTFQLGSAEVQVLAPTEEGIITDNTSIVLRVVYGNTAFLFMGDSEEPDENAILHTGLDVRADVIKIGHHGSKYSTHYALLNAVAPGAAVISVGENRYGHPSEETLKILNDAEVEVFRTDLHGNIYFFSDGEEIGVETDVVPLNEEEIWVSRSIPIEEAESVPPETTVAPTTVAPTTAAPVARPVTTSYVLNTNTLKFHLPGCRDISKMKASNRWDYQGTRDDVIKMGYKPCAHCNP